MKRSLKVLVTGGCGYIGNHVVRELSRRGFVPIIYDDLSTGHREFADGFPLVEGDIRDRAGLATALRGIGAVMHFAGCISVGESVRDPHKYFDTNAVGSLTVIEAAREAGVEGFVFSSSAAVYGIPDRSPIPEESPTRPINPYGVSKLFTERVLEAFDRAHGLRSVSLRYFNAAGAEAGGEIGERHDPETHLIPLLLAAAAGLRPQAEIYGDDYPTPDGTCIRDYTHVCDLARAHVLALEHLMAGKPSQTLNLGTGKGHSVREVVAAVERVTGKNLTVEVAPRREGDPPELVADASRARRILGWESSRTLESMVQSAWGFFQKHMDELAARSSAARFPSV